MRLVALGFLGAVQIRSNLGPFGFSNRFSDVISRSAAALLFDLAEFAEPAEMAFDR